MRKFWFYLSALVLVAAALAALVYARRQTANHSDDNPGVAATQTSQPKNNIKNACAIFTLNDAKQLLGDTAKGGNNPVYESSADFDVSTCTYTQDQGQNAPVTSRKSASLMVQAPRTATGINSNQKEFSQYKPSGVQDVAGYGGLAYWDPDHGQLDILKNNIWYTLSYGPSTPAARTLDQTKQLADLLAPKL